VQLVRNIHGLRRPVLVVGHDHVPLCGSVRRRRPPSARTLYRRAVDSKPYAFRHRVGSGFLSGRAYE